MDKQKLIDHLDKMQAKPDKFIPAIVFSEKEYDIAHTQLDFTISEIRHFIKQQDESNNELSNINQEENKGKSLIVFNKNGKTLKFEQVTDFEELCEFKEGNLVSFNRISFKYYGLSTQTKSSAIFYTNEIAGYALEEVEE